MLAEMGYAVFADDLFGQGNRPETGEARPTETVKLSQGHADPHPRRARYRARARRSAGGGHGLLLRRRRDPGPRPLGVPQPFVRHRLDHVPSNPSESNKATN